MSPEATAPDAIARATVNGNDSHGDFAEQADRLTMIMEAEAARNGIRGLTGEFAGEGSLDGYSFPLEDIDDTLAMEDAQDSSDDPLHPGDDVPTPWMSAETAAVHVISDSDSLDPDFDQSASVSDAEHLSDQGFQLTPEDETLLGLATNEE